MFEQMPSTPTSLREWFAWLLAGALSLFSLRKEVFATIDKKLDGIDKKLDGIIATASSQGERIARLEAHADTCDMIVFPSEAIHTKR
jgi:hypothetical protein